MARLAKICTFFRAQDLVPIGNFSYTARQLSGQDAMLKELRSDESDGLERPRDGALVDKRSG